MIDIKNSRRTLKSLTLGLIFLSIWFLFLPTAPAAAKSDYDTVTTLDEMSQLVLQSIHNREPVVEVRYQGDTENLMGAMERMLDEILASDDYLRYSIRSWRYGYNGYIGDVAINFRFQYLTTLEQEQFIDRKIKEILAEIIKPGMSIDDRQKAIHDYIVANVAYDETLSRYSAYNALVEGKSVCQGYAMLAYRMLKEAGIESRIIAGTAGGQSHAWNLVKIRGSWYHMDATWNDPMPDVEGRIIYEYYNLTDEEMKIDHSWDLTLYPASTVKYKYEDKSSYLSAYQNYIELPALEQIPRDKEYTVTFSKGIEIDSARERIMLLDIATGDEISCEIYFGQENRVVKIKPTVLLNKGREYLLVIHDGIKAVDGTELKQGVLCRAFVGYD